MKFKNGRTPFWNDITAVWTVFTILRMCKKNQKISNKIMLKSMKNDVPRPPKIHKKTSSEKRRENKKTQKIRFSAKMMKNWDPMDPKGGPRGLSFSCFFGDFSFLGPRWLPDTLPGVSQRTPRIVFSWFAEVLRSVFLMFSGQKDKVNHLGKTSVLI